MVSLDIVHSTNCVLAPWGCNIPGYTELVEVLVQGAWFIMFKWGSRHAPVESILCSQALEVAPALGVLAVWGLRNSSPTTIVDGVLAGSLSHVSSHLASACAPAWSNLSFGLEVGFSHGAGAANALWVVSECFGGLLGCSWHLRRSRASSRVFTVWGLRRNDCLDKQVSSRSSPLKDLVSQQSGCKRVEET